MLEVNDNKNENISFSEKQKVLEKYLKEQKVEHQKEKEIQRKQIHQQKQRENVALKKKFRDGLVYHKVPFKSRNKQIECFNKQFFNEPPLLQQTKDRKILSAWLPTNSIPRMFSYKKNNQNQSEMKISSERKVEKCKSIKPWIPSYSRPQSSLIYVTAAKEQEHPFIPVKNQLRRDMISEQKLYVEMLNSLKENENKRGRSNEKHDSEVKVSVVRMKPIRPQSMVGREFGYKQWEKQSRVVNVPTICIDQSID